MEYKLFEEFITLQALLKELGIIQSGGAIKSFLAENIVYFNGELENRRGKKNTNWRYHQYSPNETSHQSSPT